LGFGVFEEIEKTKRALSQSDETTFSFEYPGVKITEKISRKNFDEFTGRNVQQILQTVDELLKTAKLTADQVDVLCCTGGTAQIPAIQQGLADRFGREKLLHHKHFHSVVEGLAERAREIGA
jgi:hypothetical chaperone protein